MAEITKITTHVADAKDRLIEQYRDAEKLPNFHSLIEIFAQRFQGVENILEDWNKDVSIFDAIGIQLDKLGTIVGLARVSGQTDEQYRALLFIKIMQNNAQGTGEQLINVTKLLTGATVVQYVNLFNATVSLYLNIDINPTNDPSVAQFFYENIQSVLMGGVSIDGIIQILSNQNLELNDVIDIESENHGLSSLASPTIGGRLTKIYTENHTIQAGEVWITQNAPLANGYISICYSEELRKFCAVSSNYTNKIITSYDGVNWENQSYPVDNSFTAVCWSPELSLFVVVAGSGTGNRVMTSPDGINWTARTSAADLLWRSITWGNGLFVAVASSGTNNRIMTSPDGITWTSRTNPENNSWYSVTYGNGLFVAVSQTGTNRVMTSPDGINWTARLSSMQAVFQSICWSQELGLFCAVSSNAVSLSQIMTSPDGITWTNRITPNNEIYYSVCWAKDIGKFCIIASSEFSNDNLIMTSADGINWVMQTTDIVTQAKTWRSICWSSYLNMFCAVAINNSTDIIMISPL